MVHKTFLVNYLQLNFSKHYPPACLLMPAVLVQPASLDTPCRRLRDKTKMPDPCHLALAFPYPSPQ